MRSPPLTLLASACLLATTACASTASPEKTGTETFGCYVGTCVSPGVTSDDDAGSDAAARDAG